MPFGSLDRIIRAYLHGKQFPSNFGPTSLSKVIFGVAATMSEIHARGVLHRDLKPAHILIDANGEPRICGFSLSLFSSEFTHSTAAGTPIFMAPEIHRGSHFYDERIDVFSYAVSIRQLFAADIDLEGAVAPSRGHHLSRKIIAGSRLQRPAGMPDPLWKLVRACWKQEPEKRLSFGAITEMMLRSDEFVVPGTNLDEYHEYQTRIMAETEGAPLVDPVQVLDLIRDLGIDVDSMVGLRPS
jgi:serine/threonine protein kinase